MINKMKKENKKTTYLNKVNQETKFLMWEQKQYHGDIDILKEGFVDCEQAEWDGLGISYESVRQCRCSDCGDNVSELELRIFRKHSNIKDKALCKDCHSSHTVNMTMKEMARAMMNELGWSDNDIHYTLANQFKNRDDLAFMLMATSKNKSYNIDGEL